MEKILILRQRLKRIYAEYDIYILPALKFAVLFTVLLMMNHFMGYQDILTRWNTVVLICLACSLLPWSVMSFVGTVYLIGHLAALSWEMTAIAVVFVVLAAVIQYLFLPGYSIVILLIPIAYYLHIPYVVPLILGLVGGATSFIPAGVGVFFYYFVQCVLKNASFLTDTSLEQPDIVQKFTQIMVSIRDNNLMILSIIAFCVTAAIVYGIRRFSSDYAPYIAVGVGTVANILVFLVGAFAYDVTVPLVQVFVGNLISLCIAMLALFWIMAVDYTRTEYLQYEDDEYVYFVKAVPKISMTEREVKVQEITSEADDDDAYLEEALGVLKAMEDEN